jgi:hypothetical protein
MNAPTVAPAAYTVAGFCAAYGVGRTFTYAEVKAGRLRLVKAGNRTLIGAAEAQRWFDNLQRPDNHKLHKGKAARRWVPGAA